MSSIMFSILVIISTAVETWPSFLGPVPSSLRSSNLPLEWTPTDGVQWMVEVPGHGQSSPIVWGNKRNRSRVGVGVGRSMRRMPATVTAATRG